MGSSQSNICNVLDINKQDEFEKCFENYYQNLDYFDKIIQNSRGFKQKEYQQEQVEIEIDLKEDSQQLIDLVKNPNNAFTDLVYFINYYMKSKKPQRLIQSIDFIEIDNKAKSIAQMFINYQQLLVTSVNYIEQSKTKFDGKLKDQIHQFNKEKLIKDKLIEELQQQLQKQEQESQQLIQQQLSQLQSKQQILFDDQNEFQKLKEQVNLLTFQNKELQNKNELFQKQSELYKQHFEQEQQTNSKQQEIIQDLQDQLQDQQNQSNIIDQLSLNYQKQSVILQQLLVQSKLLIEEVSTLKKDKVDLEDKINYLNHQLTEKEKQFQQQQNTQIVQELKTNVVEDQQIELQQQEQILLKENLESKQIFQNQNELVNIQQQLQENIKLQEPNFIQKNQELEQKKEELQSPNIAKAEFDVSNQQQESNIKGQVEIVVEGYITIQQEQNQILKQEEQFNIERQDQQELPFNSDEHSSHKCLDDSGSQQATDLGESLSYESQQGCY